MRRLAVLIPCMLWAVAAHASPWTLNQGEVVVGTALDHQYADSEFFERGSSRSFPLEGEYEATNYRLGVRLGLTSRDELELSLPFRQVSYEARSVVLLPQGADAAIDAFDYYQENVIELSRQRSGVGDLELAARHAWIKQAFALASELRLKTPTGYDAPSGTFGDQPRTTEEFLDDPGRFVVPENVEDDVTLGDGQLDVSASLLAGYAAPGGTFLRADAGYVLRLGGAGDQVVSTLKVGQAFGRRFLLYIDGRSTLSVQSGRVIGISVAADDPRLPPEDYAGLDNLVLRELRLERDAVEAGGGVLVRLRPHVELHAGYLHTLWGRNTALIQTVYTGVSVRTEL